MVFAYIIVTIIMIVGGGVFGYLWTGAASAQAYGVMFCGIGAAVFPLTLVAANLNFKDSGGNEVSLPFWLIIPPVAIAFIIGGFINLISGKHTTNQFLCNTCYFDTLSPETSANWTNDPSLPPAQSDYPGMIRLNANHSFTPEANGLNVNINADQILLIFGTGNFNFPDIGVTGKNTCFLVITRGPYNGTLNSNNGTLEVFDVTAEASPLLWASNKVTQLKSVGKCSSVDLWIPTQQLQIVSHLPTPTPVSSNATSTITWLHNPTLPTPETECCTGMVEIKWNRSLTIETESEIKVGPEQILFVAGFGNSNFPDIGAVGDTCFLITALGPFNTHVKMKSTLLEVFDVTQEADIYLWTSTKLSQMKNADKCGEVDVWVGEHRP